MEKISFYSCFCQKYRPPTSIFLFKEWVINCVKYFFLHPLRCRMILFIYFVNTVNYNDWFLNVKELGSSETNPIWSRCISYYPFSKLLHSNQLTFC